MSIIRLLRPWQWVKNGFVFLPMFFGGRLLHSAEWTACIIGFVIFCLASSAVYCINDIKDCDSDRKDPVKCKRPIASGDVSRLTASILAITMAIGAVAAAIVYGGISAWIPCAYLVMNLAYCFGLKKLALVDVFIISLGFELRMLYGSVLTDVTLSAWIVIMVFFLTLFLGVAKRRHELALYNQLPDKKPRKSVRTYNLAFADLTLGILAAVIILGYLMYTLDPITLARFQSPYLYITAIFVVGGILRYLQITVVQANSGQPSRLVTHDIPLILILSGWFLTFMLIIYA